MKEYDNCLLDLNYRNYTSIGRPVPLTESDDPPDGLDAMPVSKLSEATVALLWAALDFFRRPNQ